MTTSARQLPSRREHDHWSVSGSSHEVVEADALGEDAVRALREMAADEQHRVGRKSRTLLGTSAP